jgi:hypothetical protein
VTGITKAGTFAGIVAALGPQALDLEATSILNNREPADPVAVGDHVKTVAPAKLH